jgi:hypothetical protein
MKQYYKLDNTVKVENPYMIMPDSNGVYLGFQAFQTKKGDVAKKHIKGLQAFIDSKLTIAELLEIGIKVYPIWAGDNGIGTKTVSGSFFAESQMKARITESF